MRMVLSVWILLALKVALCIAGNSNNNNYGVYGTNMFAESLNTYYDGFAQAWRYLGWYVQCGSPSDRYDDNGESQHSNDNNNNQYQGNNYCQRFLIWAAYVDPSYQGGGIGEYAYHDPYTQSWDQSACAAHGNGRCAPMDCHMNNSTTWELLGVFKEASYFGNDAFFEQLFKHEGVCLWNDDDLYEFMSESRQQAWTQGCVSTGIKGNDYYYDSTSRQSDGGNYLYIDLKPTWNGNMTHGLYIDRTCKTEYDGLDVDVDTIAANMGLLYGSYLDTWNDALEVYKVCQPCRAYNIKNDFDAGYNSGNRRLDGDYDYYNDPNEGYFQCDDDAGYINVNQCMKFRTHAELEVATWEDLVTATNQGGILQVNINGTIFGSERMSAEQWEYQQNKRRSEIAADARRARLQAAQVAQLEPKAKSWEITGNVAVSLGCLTLLVAILKIFRSCRIVDKSSLADPLLLPTDSD